MGISYDAKAGFGWFFDLKELEKIFKDRSKDKPKEYLEKKIVKYGLDHIVTILETGEQAYGGETYYLLVINHNLIKDAIYNKKTLSFKINRVKKLLVKLGLGDVEPDWWEGVLIH